MISAYVSLVSSLSSYNLFFIPFMLACSMMRFLSLLLLGLGLSVRLSWYPMCGCGGLCDCDACTVVFVACMSAERV